MQWLAGDESRREPLLNAIARIERDEGVTWLRAREDRRRLGRIVLASGEPVFVKHYLRSSRHPFREWWKRRLGLTTAEREWRAAARMHDAGLRVPQPLAHVRLATGDRVVLQEWIEGAPLGASLDLPPALRRARLEALGALVRNLHEMGWVHRDLHRENVLVAADALYLIDLQAARRSTGAALRRRDLGRLDFSLRGVLSIADRVRLRAVVLDAARPFDANARSAIRAIGDASLERGRIHAASRARRSLRAGRRARRLDVDAMTGLVSRDVDEAAVRDAFASPDGNSAIEVRRYAGALSDLWRGSLARRAWYMAHALEASDLPCPKPLAFLEGRSASRIALERRADAAASEEDARALRARLAEAGFAMEGDGADGIAREAASGAPIVVGLERVRFAPSGARAKPRPPCGSSPRGSSSTTR